MLESIFDEAELQGLAASIKRHGLLQPIGVRSVEGERNRYQLVYGERRWRAHQQLGLHRISARIIKNSISDAEAHRLDRDDALLALTENDKRDGLSAIEVAIAYKTIMDRHNIKQVDLAALVGRKQPVMSKYMALVRLPPEIREEAATLKAPLYELYEIAKADAAEQPLLWASLKATMEARRAELEGKSGVASASYSAGPPEAGDDDRASKVRARTLVHQSGFPRNVARSMQRAHETLGEMRASPAPLTDEDRAILERMKADIEALLAGTKEKAVV